MVKTKEVMQLIRHAVGGGGGGYKRWDFYSFYVDVFHLMSLDLSPDPVLRIATQISFTAIGQKKAYSPSMIFTQQGQR